MKTITKSILSLFVAMVAFGFANAQTATPATIAEFLAADVNENTYYELTGTISNLTNTTFGNFNLVDETGTVYVYGLTATKQTSNDKSFGSLNLVEGDMITIHGTRAEYNGSAQVGGPAYFISKIELPALTTPVATEATNVASNGFTANWEAVTNATSYDVNVWSQEEVEIATLNSSFENGLDDWDAEDAYTLSTDNAHTGSQSLAFNATATKDLRQTILYVTPGQSITVSYWYYLNASTTGNGTRLWCTWEGSDDKSLQPKDYANTKGAWTQATMTTTVPEGATALKLEIRVYKNSNGFIDDVTVSQTGMGIKKTFVEGSPFTTTTNSYNVTGLEGESTYYYNVTAKAEGYKDSELSNIIDVMTTASTGLVNTNTTSIRFDGQTIYNPENANIVVYSLVGTVVAEGNTNIDMSNQNSGIYIVRAGKSVTKIVKQ